MVCAALALVPLGNGTVAAATPETATQDVPVELWDRPRSGRAVLAVPAVRAAMAALSAKPEVRLTIRHAPGAEPLVQAEELKAWLVAHAIEPGRIALRADSTAGQVLRLEIVSQARSAQ